MAAVAAIQLPAPPHAHLMILRLSPTAPVLPRCLEAAPGSRKHFVILCRAVFNAAGCHGTSSTFSFLNSSLRGLHSPLCVWVSVLTSGKNNVILLSGSSSAFLGRINSFLVPHKPYTPFWRPSLSLGTGFSLTVLKFLHFPSILVRGMIKFTLYFPQQFFSKLTDFCSPARKEFSFKVTQCTDCVRMITMKF